ncbi:hypothetical protein PV416_30970 [Streptomyces ipomoeae]|uniref:SMP-30/gluconolactonase/LRE family protein n=1 Tax=Streptomyces ipomoeae TaxID=103232 RepID=UPI0029BA20D8|nr:hypothetical protein [Streptomyces ipomoeae]MDX2825381.1 hypothetical protein [Streptomyces ipomoeae]MDX2877112.1 hypothetical protein [Streptomyces ipomoeae]
MPRFPCLPGVAVATAALTALGAAPVPGGEPIVSRPRVVAHFDFAQGRTPENIALEPDGSADLTFALARQIAHVTERGDTRIRATLPAEANPDTPVAGDDIVLGIARADDGTLYVTYATGTGKTGVWRVAPDSSRAHQIAKLPENGLPNGIALDEHRGVLYVTDSVRGTVWRVPQKGGRATAWATGAALDPVPTSEGGSGIGANGIKIHHGAVWVSNSDRGTLLRIPVRRDGSAGPIETRATELGGIDDFGFTGRGDTVLAALLISNQVVLVRPDGTHRVVLTQHEGLSNPTSVAVRHDTVYVSSAAYFTMKDPNLLLAHLRKHQGR